ncbi:hypothetical protein [Virgibacillus litoralis]|uniref:Uncharacterized protein n=1 Tax=Virgibacillus litoralis TaxID=578221 RepID=A0ABS4HFV7_9BACI|nr:hypothetical protein [Virgibacillus litoralis]MBP1949743.1 hypothetical protein [Virgibacillus litoralis]
MNENVVAKILFIIGIAQMSIGIIVGLILGNADYYGVMNWSIFFTWAIGGFVSGMLFLGFSEIIKLLHMINEKTPSLTKEAFHNMKPLEGDSSVSWTLEELDKEKIKEKYIDEDISEIVPSPKEGFCLVKFKGDSGYYVKVVDVDRFGIEEVHDSEIKYAIIAWYNKLN